jgi:hypothetical protein
MLSDAVERQRFLQRVAPDVVAAADAAQAEHEEDDSEEQRVEEAIGAEEDLMRRLSLRYPPQNEPIIAQTKELKEDAVIVISDDDDEEDGEEGGVAVMVERKRTWEEVDAERQREGLLPLPMAAEEIAEPATTTEVARTPIADWRAALESGRQDTVEMQIRMEREALRRMTEAQLDAGERLRAEIRKATADRAKPRPAA